MARTNKGSRELRLYWYRSCDLNPARTDTHTIPIQGTAECCWLDSDSLGANC